MGSHINIKLEVGLQFGLTQTATLALTHVRASTAIFLIVRQHTNKLSLYNTIKHFKQTSQCKLFQQ